MSVVNIPNTDISYYLEDRLKYNLDKNIIPSLQKKDKDYVLVVDGGEGSGKSTLAIQIGKYVDPTLDLSRIVFDSDSFRKAIFKAKKGQVVIYDEAVTGLSARASLSGINKMLVSLMMQMRQKNLFVIIIIPTFFLLDKYVALYRARCLVHVHESRGNRGYFKIYNSKGKKYLFFTGRQFYSYNKVRCRFRGRFYGKFALGEELEKEYRKIKAKALEATGEIEEDYASKKLREQRNYLLYYLHEYKKLTYQNILEAMEQCKYPLSYAGIGVICKEYAEKATKSNI